MIPRVSPRISIGMPVEKRFFSRPRLWLVGQTNGQAWNRSVTGIIRPLNPGQLNAKRNPIAVPRPPATATLRSSSLRHVIIIRNSHLLLQLNSIRLVCPTIECQMIESPRPSQGEEDEVGEQNLLPSISSSRSGDKSIDSDEMIIPSTTSGCLLSA